MGPYTQSGGGRQGQPTGQADLATVELTLRAELASDYFDLRSYDQRQVLLDQTVGDYVQDRAKATLLEQAANYRNTVLTAYREVEDSLAALRQLDEESRTQAAAVTATGVSLGQARIRYEEGQVTYLEVATTETAALQAQLAALMIQARRLETSVLLIKALGGGWEIPKPTVGRR